MLSTVSFYLSSQASYLLFQLSIFALYYIQSVRILSTASGTQASVIGILSTGAEAREDGVTFSGQSGAGAEAVMDTSRGEINRFRQGGMFC